MTIPGTALALLRSEFGGEVYERLDALERALAEPSSAAALALAHRLKGSALVLGLSGVVEELESVEAALANGSRDHDRAAVALAAARRAAHRELGTETPDQGRAVEAVAGDSSGRHELMSPLNVILGHAELLQSAGLVGTVRDHVDAIVEAGLRLQALVVNLGGRALSSSRSVVESLPPGTPALETATPGLHRVLLIEDDAANIRLVETMLGRRPSCRLIVARSGVAGVAAAADHHPDLVLLDLGLADLGGAEVLRRIRATARPDLPVMIVSGYDDPSLRRELTAAGATGFLPKPLSVDRLFDVLDGLPTYFPE